MFHKEFFSAQYGRLAFMLQLRAQKDRAAVNNQAALYLVVNYNSRADVDIVIDPLRIRECHSNTAVGQAFPKLIVRRQDSMEEITTSNLRAPTRSAIGRQRSALIPRRAERSRYRRGARRTCHAAPVVL